MPEPVRTKEDFARRYAKGEFGNMSPTWSSVAEFMASPWHTERLYHLRNRVAWGPTFYKLRGPVSVAKKYRQCLEKGAKADSFYVSEQVPEHVEKSLRLQGEVMQAPGGLVLTYSTVPLPMRDALRKETKHAQGLQALLLLQWAMDAVSYDWLQELLTNYQGHVIEFSSYDYCWGKLPWNTIFWEVRRY